MLRIKGIQGRRRLVVLFGVIVALTLATTACGGSESAPKNKVDASLPALTSDLTGGNLLRTIPVPGETFSVQTSYSSVYAAKHSWNITQDKTLQLQLKLVAPVPAGTVVYVEHFHADASIAAKKASVDGIPQDSMDDSMHGGTDPGFQVDTVHGYSTIFSIAGYSQSLISGWMFQSGGSGAGEISDDRLTEANLRGDGGATGNRFTFIYDLIIKGEGDLGFHKVAVQDTFFVPVS